MGILLGLLSALFWPAVIIAIIVYVVKRTTGSTSTPISPSYAQLDETAIRTKIASEIRAQSVEYKTPGQKKVVEDMASTVEYFAEHSYHEQASAESYRLEPISAPMLSAPDIEISSPAAARAQVAQPVSQEVYETPWKKLQVLDGATILLYLGAFFLLASIGLYVGLGQGDTLKSVLVSLLVAGFYGAGVYLQRYTTRLKPVGATFASIGMATLPMAGAAVYYFSLGKSHGAAVWLTTSIVGMALYLHALKVFRTTLVSYMVVFSSISVVLASISAVGLGPYYFIQGVGLAGVVFAFVSRLLKKNDQLTGDAYEKSASFMVPFSIAMSVLFIARIGWLQLSLSLALGAVYYLNLAYASSESRRHYVLITQILSVLTLGSFVYGLRASVIDVAVLSGLISIGYLIVWAGTMAKREVSDPYRQQVKGFLLAMPLLCIGLLLGTPGSIWIGIALLAITGSMVYARDRDAVSGALWTSSVLIVPFVINSYTLSTRAADQYMAGVYAMIAMTSSLVLWACRRRIVVVDRGIQTYLWISAIAASVLYVMSVSDRMQLVMLCVYVIASAAQSYQSIQKKLWFSITSPLLGLSLGLFILSGPYFVAALTIFGGYNLLLAASRRLDAVHDWIAVLAILSLPLAYGELVADPVWSSRAYLFAYAIILAVFVAARIKRLLGQSPLVPGYLAATLGVLVAGILSSALVAVTATVSVAAVLYLFDKVEQSRSFGSLVPFVPLALLFASSDLNNRHYLGVLLALFGLLSAVLYVRRWYYDAYASAIYGVLLVWHVIANMVHPSRAVGMYVFFGVTTAILLVRAVLRSKVLLRGPLMLAYALLFGIGVIYMLLAGGWIHVAVGLFVIGLIVTGMSYVEDQPVLIIPALLLGFGSILRLCIGYELGVTTPTVLLMALAHGVYWLLIGSRLDTVRAHYARYTLLGVAALIPIFGLGFTDYIVFPISLALLGGMVLYEVRNSDQLLKELAVAFIHVSALWALAIAGVKEVQVYTQLSALLIAFFAYLRRRNQDAPSTINTYLWLAVCTFTLPMVWQALTDSDPMYSYLLLVEHVLLIVLSIVLKRATFAWWGIIVVVAAVLYQLRKLRYAALAFLGAFIISLAVYFLLRYNKPDEGAK